MNRIKTVKLNPLAAGWERPLCLAIAEFQRTGNKDARARALALAEEFGVMGKLSDFRFLQRYGFLCGVLCEIRDTLKTLSAEAKRGD